MSSYQRTTRECSVQQLRPEFLRALKEYFQAHQLGDPAAETLLCCETVSEKKPGGWLPDWLYSNSETNIRTCILLTARSLVWARKGDTPEIRVVGAELANIQTRTSPAFFSRNLGLEIIGLVEGSKSNIHGTIALGPEPEALNFCNEVHQAINKINPPPVNKWPRWMGGPKQ